jgi:hypothetical protein
MQDNSPTVGQEISRIEKDLGIAENYLERLIDEDDWSFVVKLHAYLDGALSRLLTTHLAQPNLLDVFARMDLANQRTGKLAFIIALNLLTKTSIEYVQILTELRNRYVHNVAIAGTKLSDNIDTLTPDKLCKLAKAARLSDDAVDVLGKKDLDIELKKFSMVFAKRMLWYGAFAVLEEIVGSRYWSEREHETRQLAYNFFARIAENISLKG